MVASHERLIATNTITQKYNNYLFIMSVALSARPKLPNTIIQNKQQLFNYNERKRRIYKIMIIIKL